MQSGNSSIDTTTQRRVQTCMNGLEKLSKVWVATKIVYNRFENILGGTGFRRNSQGAFELVKRRHCTENTTNGSDQSQNHSMTTKFVSNQTAPLQFRDRLRPVVPDPITAFLAQNESTSSTIASSAFQTLNVLSLAGSIGYDTTNPPPKSSYPASVLSLHSFYDP
jgi:hypothetical protein